MKIERTESGDSFVAWGPKATAAWTTAVVTALGLSLTDLATHKDKLERAIKGVKEEFHLHSDRRYADTQRAVEYILGITEKRGEQISKNREDISKLREECSSSKAALRAQEKQVTRIEQMLLKHLKLDSDNFVEGLGHEQAPSRGGTNG